MKKVLSIVLVLVMLLGIAAIATSATPAVAPTVSENGYQSVEAHYFGGSLDLSWLTGKSSLSPAKKDSQGYADGVEHVRDAIDSDSGTLVIDGKISEGEWGDPVVSISSDYAANNMNLKGEITSNYKNNTFETPSAENTYFYNNFYKAPEAGLNFELYLMWDEDYFYVALKSNDPDGPRQVNTGGSIWDGDCLQMKIDPKGVNASCEGGKYSAETKSYTRVSGWDDTYIVQPWYGSEPSEVSGLDHYPYGDFMFSYVTSDGGRTEAYDAQARWDPEWSEYDYTGKGDVPMTWKGYTYSSADISILSDNEEIQEDPCYAVVRWDNYGTAKERNDIAVYEIALPWSIICKDSCPDYEAVAGNVLGMSACLLDAGILNTPAGAATDGFTSYLSWGCGIATYQTMYDSHTTAGNNAVVLSADSYTEYKACDHDFSAATCITPETCKTCGYQRGYKAGHKYVYSDPVLPTTTTNGSLVGTCTVCNDVQTYKLDADESQLAFEYNESSDNPVNVSGMGAGYTTNWYDDTVSNAARKMLYKADGTSKNPWDTEIFGYSIIDCASRGDGLYYSDMTPATIAPDMNGSSQSGTYFELGLKSKTKASSNKEYGYSYDFYVTDWAIPENHSYYTPGIYAMFGGSHNTSYGAGLYYTDNWAYIAIGKYDDLSLHLNYYNTAEEFEADCYSFCKLDRQALEANPGWHTINYIYDSDDGVMMIYFDGKFACAAQDKYFTCSMDNLSYIITRRFETPFYMKNIRVATASWTADHYNLSGKTGYNLTVDGVTSQVSAGETVNLSALAFNEGYRFIGWEGDTSVLTDNVYNASFEMPAQDVTLTSKYVLVGDANGDGKINAQDANFLSQIIVGSVASVVPADINNDDKVNATDSNMLTKMITGTYAPIA